MARRRAPRSLWTGSISFGLVNVPVRVYTAVHEHKLRFHLVHETDDGPIGYEKVCKLEGEPVADDEIVKAYEVKKGTIVHVADEDFEAAEVEGTRTITLEDFVPYEQIDPTFFAHTYLVGPQEGAEHAYALLVEAMEESGLAGIGRFVMRNRQYLGCLRVRERTLTLEQMYFADEIDTPKGAIPDRLPSVPDRELKMATSLIESFAGDWTPEKYEDTYTEALRKVIERKRKGEQVDRAPDVEEEAPADLMEALRASVEAAARSGGRTRAKPRRTGRGGKTTKEPKRTRRAGRR